MTVGDLFGTAWANLDRRKGRTALTCAGVVVGVAALVLMVSLGLGLQRQVAQLFETEEARRSLSVTKERAGGKKKAPSPFPMDFQITPVTDKDLEELRKIPGVVSAQPELNAFVQVAFEGSDTVLPYLLDGVAPEEEAWFSRHLVAGALWSSPDEKAAVVPVDLLESRASMKPADAVGKKLRIGVKSQEAGGDEDVVTVVGVVDSGLLGLRGKQIFLPMEQALGVRERRSVHPFIPSKRGVYLSADVKVADPKQAAEVAERIRKAGYAATSANEILKQINIVFLVIEGFMACIGAIGLVVSLFGIANTMAMAVLERTREIGIMKALGARNADVGRLFLVEAGAIGLLGGIVGLAAGTGAGLVLNLAARPLFDLPPKVSLFHVSLWLALGSVGFSILVSVLAGFLPARRAAKMEPVAALRYE